jgi:hypothetical protein
MCKKIGFWAAVAFALFVGRVQACDDPTWFNLAWADVFLVPPPAPPDQVNVYLTNGVLNHDRYSTALGLLLTQGYQLELLGFGDGQNPPRAQGWFQTFLNRNPTGQEAIFYLTADFGGGMTDEEIIADIIDHNFAEYYAREDQTLAACNPGKALLDLLCRDLLGRASDDTDFTNLPIIAVAGDQVSLPITVNGQQTQVTVALSVIVLSLEAGIIQTNSQGLTYDVEYHRIYVRNAFLRYLHRLPDPTPNGERDQYVGWITGQLASPDEDIDAVLIASDQFCDAQAIAFAPGPQPPAHVAVPAPPAVAIQPDAQSIAPQQINFVQAGQAVSVQGFQESFAQQQQALNLAQNQVTALAQLNAGAAATGVDAQAMQAAANSQILVAIGVAGASDISVTHAQKKVAMGDEAQAVGDFDQAVRDYTGALRDALKAATKK